MKKNLIKHISIISIVAIITFGGIWINNWRSGKVSPSVADTSAVKADHETAYFAGGCFWCTESDYEKITGVKEAVSGYMGGDLESPSYDQVSSGETGHREAVKVIYNPDEVTYKKLVFELLKETDPTDNGGSFYDRGHQYTSAIYYQNDLEKEIAKEVTEKIEEARVFEKPIVTSVELVRTFWIAEDYHQDYYKKNPLPYKYYRNASGRDKFIKSVWGDREFEDFFKDETLAEGGTIPDWRNFHKPSDEVLKKTLSPIQYSVTQKEGTERPFQNEYWDNHADGIYVDIVSGEPLFSSTDKFDSGTGWPSFLKPINKDFVTERQDYKLIIPRTEIRSKIADSHLGHIILDGPIENNKIRYCMNSASLRFIPVEDLEKLGYGEFGYLFE